MKFIFLLLLSLFYSIQSFTQDTPPDTLKQLTHLRTLKSELVVRSTLLQGSMARRQQLIDSIQKK
jgi:hypothetical protein